MKNLQNKRFYATSQAARTLKRKTPALQVESINDDALVEQHSDDQGFELRRYFVLHNNMKAEDIVNKFPLYASFPSVWQEDVGFIYFSFIILLSFIIHSCLLYRS